MITNLNFVTKTFAKIAKMFAGLSTTIVVMRGRPVLILHLEAKYAKMDCKNEIYTKKLGKEHLDCKKSTLRKSQWSMVNNLSQSQQSTPMMT